MILIPGELIAVLTFPGVILHEFAHKIACNLLDIKINQICYFQAKNPSGYVIHEPPNTIFESLLITIMPIIIGYGCAAFIALITNDLATNFLWWVGMWFSFSLSMHALSSSEDVDNLWAYLRGQRFILEHEGQYVEISYTSPLTWRIVLYPLGTIIKIISALRVLWADAIISYFLIFAVIRVSG